MRAEQELRVPFLLPRFSAHILRHTACTRLSEQGMPATVLQRIMGHKNISMTMNVYNHSDQERLRHEMKRIDELRQNSTTYLPQFQNHVAPIFAPIACEDM